MKKVLIILILFLGCQLGYAQIIADSTYNPLIKRNSTLYKALIGKDIDSLHEGLIGGQLLELKGQKTHINLWSTTCRPCIQEFPELNELQQEFNQSDITFIAIAKEPKVKTERILSKNPLNYELMFDGAEFFRALGVKQYPVNLFINEEGIIEELTTGVFMKGEIIDGKTVMNMHNLPYYKMILSQWTNP